MIGYVFNQRFWPGAGDLDDCWVVASIQAAHATSPWLPLVGVGTFRAAAGKPDLAGITGGNEHDMGVGLRAIYPTLVVEVIDGAGWAAFEGQLRLHRPAVVIGLTSKLPAAYQFAGEGVHAVAVFYTNGGELLLCNPMAPPHSKPLPMTFAQLRTFSEGYQPKVHGILLPTESKAFDSHPLLPGKVAAATAAATAKVGEIKQTVATAAAKVAAA